jgi:hypothetical protein
MLTTHNCGAVKATIAGEEVTGQISAVSIHSPCRLASEDVELVTQQNA